MNNTSVLTTAALFSVLTFYSCNENNILDNTELPIENQTTTIDVGVYPLSSEFKNKLSNTRTNISGSFETDWENTNSVMLATGKSISLPWSMEPHLSNIPVSLAFDIKKEDGWQMIYHSFNGPVNLNEGMNFMIFSNKLTGFMKVFYYLEDKGFQNNTGFFNLEFTGSQKLLNATADVTIPINVGELSYWRCSNPSTGNELGMRWGWNGFQVMLSYDPNKMSSLILDIISQSGNISNVDLFGDFNGYSKGTITSYGSTNRLESLKGSLATVFGDEASKWINDKIKKPNQDKNSAQIDSKGLGAGIVSSIVHNGINKIFTSFIGRFNKPTTSQSDLEFKTRMTGTIAGTISFESNTSIPTLRLPAFTPEKLGIQLGAWNLQDIPTVYMYKTGYYTPGYGDSVREYQYKSGGISRYEYKLLLNPELEKYVVKKWVNIDMVRYYSKNFSPYLENPIPNYNHGTLGQVNHSTFLPFDANEVIYGKHMQEGAIYQIKNIQKTVTLTPEYGSQFPTAPERIDLSRTPIREGNKIGSEYYMRFTLNLVTEVEGKRDTIVSTRTYAPKL